MPFWKKDPAKEYRRLFVSDPDARDFVLGLADYERQAGTPIQNANTCVEQIGKLKRQLEYAKAYTPPPDMVDYHALLIKSYEARIEKIGEEEKVYRNSLLF